MFYRPAPNNVTVAQAEKMGQKGDKHLAFINDEERALLTRRGGADKPHPLFPNIRQYFSEGDGPDGQGQDGGVSGGGGVDAGVVDAIGIDTGASQGSAPGVTGGPSDGNGGGAGVGGDGGGISSSNPAGPHDPGVQSPNISPEENEQNVQQAQALNDQLDPSTSKSMHQIMSVLGINSRGLSMGAAVAGMGIAAITGATAPGAAQGQSVVGVGGPNASTNPGTVSAVGGINESTGPNSVSTNTVAPGDAGGGAPYDAYAQSIASAAMPKNTGRASGTNINSNLLTYAFSLMGLY